MIHSDLIFVAVINLYLNPFLWPVNVHMFQHHLLKRFILLLNGLFFFKYISLSLFLSSMIKGFSQEYFHISFIVAIFEVSGLVSDSCLTLLSFSTVFCGVCYFSYTLENLCLVSLE
jgi:hypothetical protein